MLLLSEQLWCLTASDHRSCESRLSTAKSNLKQAMLRDERLTQGPQVFVVRAGTGQAYLRNPPSDNLSSVLHKDIKLHTGSESLASLLSIAFYSL